MVRAHKQADEPRQEQPTTMARGNLMTRTSKATPRRTITPAVGVSMKKILQQAYTERFTQPAARDLIHAADDYARLAHDLKTTQEAQRRIKREIAASIRGASARRLETLKRIDTLLLLSRKRDAEAAKLALNAAFSRYASRPQ
jgi:hypothetical protein